MIAVICLFCPPVLMVCFFEKWWGKTWSKKQYILNYVICLLILNVICLSILSFILKNNENVLMKLDQYNDFAVKYISLSSFFAITIPYIIYICKDKLSIHWTSLEDKGDHRDWRALASIYAVSLFLLNFIRIFDGYFWLDEAWSLYLSRVDVGEMIRETAQDVHPPLYYLILQTACKIGGHSGIVYHFVSLIPYVLVLIIALTFIWERLGKGTAIILVSFASLLPNAIQFNVEVRMYSWGALFVLLSFLALYEILTEDRPQDYIWFSVFSLAASYTHYYCLISVSFFYLVLLVLAMIKRKGYLLKVVMAYIATAIGYLPWSFILIASLKRVSKGFWISKIPIFKDCIGYLFSSKYQFIFVAIMLMGSVFFFFDELQIFKVKKVDDGKHAILFDLSAVRVSATAIWIFAGVLSIFGTMFIGIIVSEMIRPLFFLRYLYPVSIIAWLIFGFCATRYKRKKLYSILIVLLIFVSCIPQYKDIYQQERSLNDKLQTTLAATKDKIDMDDVILTDILQIDSPILDHYYPEVEHHLIDLAAMPDLEDGRAHWLIVSSAMKEEFYDDLAVQGYFCEEIVNGGSLGNYTVYIYRLDKR